MGNNDQMNDNNEVDTVTLTLDDNSVIECAVICVFEAGSQSYIALQPMEGKDADEGQVYLYRYSEDETGEPVLDNIEDDEEFEIASDAFDEYIDELEFEQMVAEDED